MHHIRLQLILPRKKDPGSITANRNRNKTFLNIELDIRMLIYVMKSLSQLNEKTNRNN